MWKRNHSLPEQIERGLDMNENLFRPQFDALKLSDKLWLMQTLATRRAGRGQGRGGGDTRKPREHCTRRMQIRGGKGSC